MTARHGTARVTAAFIDTHTRVMEQWQWQRGHSVGSGSGSTGNSVQPAGTGSGSPFVKCHYCTKDFTSNSNRRRHEARLHGVRHSRHTNASSHSHREAAGQTVAVHVADAAVTCTLCNKVFATARAKRIHELTLHGVKAVAVARGCTDGRTAVTVICKHCNVNFNTLNDYRQHLLQQHQIETRKTRLVFASEQGKLH